MRRAGMKTAGMKTAVAGYPRIGTLRELKFALNISEKK
jgi:5-methyltetrahydropteroyltriglutamate--homocysteine methyltransferase